VFARRGDFKRAEGYRLRALDAHYRAPDPLHPEMLLDLTNLIDIYWRCGENSRADTLLGYLLTLGGKPPSPDDRNLAEMLRQLLETAVSDFRLDLAERLGARAIELLEATEGAGAPETLKAIHRLANVHRAVGNYDAAEQALYRARNGYEGRHMSAEALEVAVDLSKLYRNRGAYPVAEKLLEDVLAQLRKSPEKDAEKLASVLGNLALVHYDTEQYPRRLS
jgi:tetratricopeptide (TPR) repeat protein